MGRNASLDDFADGDPTPDPINPVQAWHPEGIMCPTCETTVKELWIEDGSPVCHACREW